MMLEIQALKYFLKWVTSCARIQSEILMRVVFTGMYLKSLLSLLRFLLPNGYEFVQSLGS